jgi:phage baseplate assembly protein W
MANAFSLEDKNLDVSTILTSRTRAYKDIDLTFKNIPISGEIYRKTEAAAVKQAVKNLVMTNFAEKPFLPTFGGNIRSLLFELADEDAEEDIENNVISAINKFEPRARTLNVEAISNPDRNAVDVTIVFQVVNTQEEVSLSIVLARLR